MLKNRPQNHRKCSQNDPRGAPGERSWNLPRGIGKKTSILIRFWSLLGSPGLSLGDPGGTRFRPWTLPGRPQGAQGANFKASWASPLFDADSGSPKSPKKLNFERARPSKIGLAPRWQRNFHFLTNFAPGPENRRCWDLFWKPFGCHLAFWAPLAAPRNARGAPGSSKTPAGGSKTPQEVPRPPGTPMGEPAYTNAPGVQDPIYM